MAPDDLEPIVTIALMASQADGLSSPEELVRLKAAAQRLGVANPDAIVDRLSAGRVPLSELAKRLSDDKARRLAYQTALLVCQADGETNPAETQFLGNLRTALGLTPMAVSQVEESAVALASAPVPASPAPAPAASAPASRDAALDDVILKQAMLTGALELLPEGIANLAILPLQLRLVYLVGQQYGQQLDTDQIKDLAGTLGIGAVAQVMEGVVRKLVGGVGGVFGGLVGGATSVAAGAAVTFATTYALGHAAKQYYAQGRHLSSEDLRALFARFKAEAEGLYPKVRDQVQAKAKSLNLENVMGMLR
jgi:uncharacterized protein (DUF697 family)/tellurite resistance protein